MLLDGATAAGIDDELEGQRVLRHERDRARALRAADAERRALAAAIELAAKTRWLDHGVELPLGLVFGPLLAHPTAKWIGFELDGQEPACFSRAKLRATKPALRRFGDLIAYLDHHGLHFRWHSGKGGLDYYPGRLDWREKQSVLLVPLPRPVVIERAPADQPPAPAPPPASRGPRRARPSGAWLGDILSDLGLLG